MGESTDGRHTRWAQHRVDRRRELVRSTLRAIRRHGPGVGMDEIAAEAGTSKTVIYRHFGSRADIYMAVVESVHRYILDELSSAMSAAESDELAVLLPKVVDAYLVLVERDPHIYRFVVDRPQIADPVDDQIGAQLTAVLARQLDARGLPEQPAASWGYGIVGFIRAAADRWLVSGMPQQRATLVADICAFFQPALTARFPQGPVGALSSTDGTTGHSGPPHDTARTPGTTQENLRRNHDRADR